MTPHAAARWRRFGAATFAAALTLLPLAALYQRASPRPAAVLHERVAYLSPWRPQVAMPATPPQPAAAAVPRALQRPAASKALPPLRRGAPAAPDTAAAITSTTTPGIETPPAAQAAVAAVEAEPPQPAASAPLKLDGAVMRAAANASKSGARNMAEASGAYFGSDPVAQTDKLGRAVAETAKSDCIRPGGSLLSIFVIAYEVARDKCK